MLVEELLEQLEGMDKDAEVRFAAQPNYPMEYAIGEVVQVDTSQLSDEDLSEIEEGVDGSIELGEFDASERQESIDILVEQYKASTPDRQWGGEENGLVVYLSEDRQVGYLNSKASEELGWN